MRHRQYYSRPLISSQRKIDIAQKITSKDFQNGDFHIQDLTILGGCEAKVMNEEGGIDASEDVLKLYDIVVGVFHGFDYADKQAYSKHKRALEKKGVIIAMSDYAVIEICLNKLKFYNKLKRKFCIPCYQVCVSAFSYR